MFRRYIGRHRQGQPVKVPTYQYVTFARITAADAAAIETALARLRRPRGRV